jgi:hypothetical protein
MKRQAVSAAAIGWLACCAIALAHPGHDAKPLEHFTWLRQLAGSCWAGEHPDGRTRDTQCFQIQYERFLRSTTRLSELRAGKWEQRFEGETILAWDDANQRISYWYWTSTGAFGPAEAYLEGEQIHFPASRKPGASAVEVRTSWSPIDATSYRVSRQKRTGGEWKEMFVVVYKRVAEK